MAEARFSTRLFRRWTAFAGAVQYVVITTLFGAIYLVIVPWFALASWAIASSRRRRHGASTWIIKDSAPRDGRFFDRMG